MHIPLLKEHIGLIQEEYGSPGVTDIENLLQFALEETGICSELTGRHYVKRALEQFADALSSERLAGAGGPMQDS